MSLTAASTIARRARKGRPDPLAPLASLQNPAVACYRRDQTRAFRFGRLWSTYLDPELQRDRCRRQQALGYKNCENLGRRLSLNKRTFAEDVKSTLKRVVHHDWQPYRWAVRGSGRCMNTAASPRRTPDNPEGIRPGHNIEDAERAPLEHFLFGCKKGQRVKRRARPGATQDTSTLAASPQPNNDYVIDPITNRKVPRDPLTSSYSTTDQGVEIPVATFKSYRSQFAPFRAPEAENSQTSVGTRPLSNRPAGKGQNDQSTTSHYGAARSSLLDTLRWEHQEVRWHPSDSIASTATAAANGASAQYPDTPEYLDLHRYTAVKYREPDGKPAGESHSSPPEDLSLYGAVRSHEPDGKYKAEAEAPADPQELNAYEAFRSHEPNGKYAADYTEAPDEVELAEYSKPFRAHEPDGMYAATCAEPGYDAAELAKYRNPFFCYEPDGKYAASYVEPKHDEAELARYGAFRSHEPDGKYAAANHTEREPDSSELATYGPFRSHEPDGKYAAAHIEPKQESSDLATYGPFRSHEPDGKYAASNTTPAADPAAAEEYEAFRSHEPDGKYAAEAKAAEEIQDLGNHEAFGYEDAETRPPPEESQESTQPHDLEGYRTAQPDDPDGSAMSSSADNGYDPAELGKYQAVRWNEPDGKPAELEASGKEHFEYDLNGSDSITEPSTSRADSAARLDQKPVRLTGNYVRDFPEEFVKTWDIEPSENDAPTSGTSESVQPALERLAAHTAAAEPASADATPSAEPALYKILVYDPTMQCVETAETTSVVPDSAAPLTPAEVLLRISQPAKFFPHFAPLRAQGFEIVSGSGDVLIFRKVRDAAVNNVSQSSKPAATTAVNPIDMTGGRRDYTVAAGRFASPTGFVNYDLPAPPPPPPQSVESTARSEEAGGEETAAPASAATAAGPIGKKSSLPKKVVVGTAWLAGISYSIGVMSEYFKTGGSEGKGPKGF